MVEIRFTEPFRKRIKKLAKRYRSIQKDIAPIIKQLQEGILIGEQITDIKATQRHLALITTLSKRPTPIVTCIFHFPI